MKRTTPLRMLAAIFGLWLISVASQTHAATERNPYLHHERETGRQKLTPTVSTALTIPAGTTHALFWIESGPIFWRGDGVAPEDTAGVGASWNASKWPEGFVWKEENDGNKLIGLRFLCASCTVWVTYSRERRNTDPVP